MGDRFYVVQTHPRAEPVAQANLQSQDFEVYCPTLTTERKIKHVVVCTMEPLFPSYMFVRLNMRDARWRAVCSTRGVQRLLGPGPETPSPVPHGIVENIKERFSAGEYFPDPSVNTVNVGEVARIFGGAFDGHTGECKETRVDRVKLLIKLLGTAVEVYFPVAQVARA